MFDAPRSAFALLAAALLSGTAPRARAADVDASPTTFKSLLGSLKPGDIMRLAAGKYPHFTIDGLRGTPDAWITIAGPPSGDAAVVEADPGPCCNTIEITNSSHVAVVGLTVDGLNVDGAFGVSAKGGVANVVHDIRIEDSTFLHHDTSQQNVAISTKAPTWGWIIRRNRIVGAGTGMYLGNSDGTCPFVGGLIEQNLVQDTIGYNIEIKWQQPRPTVAGMPTSPTSTVLRHNVFIKTDRPSPDGDRPNLLTGGFPDTGAGSTDRYEIYGNLFVHNPRESLLQASGRVSIHDNVFVDVVGNAVLLQNHDLPLRQAYVYNNTIYGAGTGIRFGSAAAQGDGVVGNLVFASTPIAGTISAQRDNLVDTVAAAATYVTRPSLVLGEMDFYPLAGRCQGTPLDLSTFASDVDRDRDFNGTSKGDFRFRGAYAGEGVNPGWRLVADRKIAQAGSGPDAGAQPDAAAPADGAAPSVDAAAPVVDAGVSANAGPTAAEPSGCGCRLAPDRDRVGQRFVAVFLVLAAWPRGRRRRMARTA